MYKYISVIILFFLSLTSFSQTYNPANFTVSNKSFGISQNVPTDARSQFYDATNFVMRDYASKSEVMTYLNLPKYRQGHFPVYIHNGGTLTGGGVWIGGTTDIYVFKDSTDINSLVYWNTVQSVNGQQGVVITKNADSIRGKAVDTTVASGSKNNYLLTYDSTNNKWKLVAPAAAYTAGTGIDITGIVISALNTQALWNANSLRGRSITTGTPSVGNTITWNGTSWIYSGLNGLDTAYLSNDTLYLINTFDTISVNLSSLVITNRSGTGDTLLINNQIKRLQAGAWLLNTPSSTNIKLDVDSAAVVARVRQIVGDSSSNYIINDTTIIQNGGFKLGTGSKIQTDTLKIGYTSTGLSTDSVLVKGTNGVVRKVAQVNSISDQLIVEKILQDTVTGSNKINGASIIEIGGDSLLATAIVFPGATDDNDPQQIWKWYSTDNGRSWGTGSIAINYVGINYPQTPSLYRKSNGDILMVGLLKQAVDSSWIVFWVSSDKGQTWSSHTRINVAGRYFGPMSDRLFKYGNRLYYPYSANAGTGTPWGQLLYSDDEGATWDTTAWRITDPVSEPGIYHAYTKTGNDRLVYYWRNTSSYPIYAHILTPDGSAVLEKINTGILSLDATVTIKQVGEEKNWVAIYNPMPDTTGLSRRRVFVLGQSTDGYFFQQANVLVRDSNTVFYEPSITFIKNRYFIATYSAANESLVQANPATAKFTLKYFNVPAGRISLNGSIGKMPSFIVSSNAEIELNNGRVDYRNDQISFYKFDKDHMQVNKPVVFAPDNVSNYLSGSGEKIQLLTIGASRYNDVLLRHSYSDVGDYGNFIKFEKTNGGSFDVPGQISGRLDFQQGTSSLQGRMNSLYYPSSTTSLIDLVYKACNASGVCADRFSITSEGIGYFQNKLGVGNISPDEALHVNGNTKLSGTYPYLLLTATGAGYNTYVQGGLDITGGSSGSYLSFQTPANRGYTFNVNGVSKLNIDPVNSFIGINKSAPIFGLDINYSVAINKDSATRVTSIGTNVVALIDTANGKVQTITGVNLATALGVTSYTFSTGLTNTSGTITNNLSTGVSGGQSIIGGTASGNNLTLSSTTNGTKGKVILGSASAYDEVNDRLGIGTTSPTARLHLPAGTATASTAPLKLTSGTNLTTPEAGAVEFDGTNYYASASTTRYTLAKTLTDTSTLDFPNTNAGDRSDLTITITGAAVGDVVALAIPHSAIALNGMYMAWVSASNTVTIRFINNTGGNLDPSPGLFRASVLKY